MKPRQFLALALLPATLGLHQAHAQNGSDNGWLVQGALDAGLDETIDSSGDTYRIGTTQAIGVGYEIANEGEWLTRISLSYEFNEGDVGDTTNEFSVWPLEVLLLHQLGVTRIGVGAGYHAEPKYTAELNGAETEIEFDNAFSFIATVEMTPVRYFSIGARYTHVEYGVQDTSFVFDDGSSKEQIDGRSIGIFALARF